MAEYQISMNGPDDDFGHSFLPEFKRFERFASTLPFDITPQERIANGEWTMFTLPSTYDRILSAMISAPILEGGKGAWTAEKMIDEIVISGGDQTIIQRITNNHIRFWYQCLSESRKNTWDKMSSGTEIGEKVYLDLPLSMFQDSASSLIPWSIVHLHVKWSDRVETLVDIGEIVVNTRNVLIDKDQYDELSGEDPLVVLDRNNEHKQLIVQTHEQTTTQYNNSATVPMDLRGPCKDIWFGLKANADFSAHTLDVATDDLYIVEPTGEVQPHQSIGVVRLSSPTALGQTLTSAYFTANDDKLFAEQNASFYNKLIPYYRYTGCPAPGYYYYSFALNPLQHQPSGTCNFSRLGKKNIHITNDPYESSLHVISNRYNVTEKNIPLFLD